VFRRRHLFKLYVTAVIMAGFTALVAVLSQAHFTRLAGRHPAAACVFFIGLIVAELKPIKWLRQHEGGEITVSWTFAFALLFVAPAAGALLSIAVASVIGDVVHRKPLVRILFNSAQVTLSLSAGALVMTLSGQRGGLLPSSGPSLLWLACAAAAGALVFLLNGMLTSVVLALYQNLPVSPTVRAGAKSNLSTDGTLLALAPIFVVIALHSLLLLPLLLATAYAVYKTAYLALARQHEANHDLLTDLPNRRLFYAQVTDMLEPTSRRRLAVMLLDLDGFKEINDRLGHHIGDLVLQEVANRLEKAKRPGDLVARLGGDEFAILVSDLGFSDAPTTARNFLQTLEVPCMVDGFPVSVSGSCGIALYPEHGSDVESLMRQADTAMYAAKSGHLGVMTSSATGPAAGRGRLTLLGELQKAISAEQLILHYQPKIDLPSGEVVGVEALVRWEHPKLGLLPPDEFIPLAEHTELMAPFTEYVLERALAQCAAWRSDGINLVMAVNGSARNFHDRRFPVTVERLLRDTHVDPSWLELEITENTVMADPERTMWGLSKLRGMGVTLSIDDFGTGYSSLANLRNLPVDRIKIDRSFVRDMVTQRQDALIVRSMIELANNLGLETVAEGIEDEEVRTMLNQLGCQTAQGYLIARPASATDTLAWVQRRRLLMDAVRAGS
jgi:diguanylate cyclase (GGDEF)-like protein